MQELQPPEDGLFLVRESVRHPGDYVLCVSFGKEVIHYRVVHEENTLSIDSQQYFSNLIDMIEVSLPPWAVSPASARPRAGTSWGHLEQWQVPVPFSCVFLWILLLGIILPRCQRLVIPSQFGVQRTDLGCPGDILCQPATAPVLPRATFPHPCSFGASRSSGAQGILENEDPGSLCHPGQSLSPARALRRFVTFLSPPSPLSPADPTGLPGCPVSSRPPSSSSRSIFVLSHSHCLSPLQRLHMCVLYTTSAFRWVLSPFSCTGPAL